MAARFTAKIMPTIDSNSDAVASCLAVFASERDFREAATGHQQCSHYYVVIGHFRHIILSEINAALSQRTLAYFVTAVDPIRSLFHCKTVHDNIHVARTF